MDGSSAEDRQRESSDGAPALLERCPVCHDVAVFADAVTHAVRCSHCDADLADADTRTPVVAGGEGELRWRIFPVLTWVRSACQSCGADERVGFGVGHGPLGGTGEPGLWCPDCRGPRGRELTRERLDGLDEMVAVTDFDAPLQLGNPCVSAVSSNVELVGVGPFHALQVVGTWPSGHLDVVAEEGLHLYVGVPTEALQPISR